MTNAMLERLIRREDIAAAFQACAPQWQLVMALRALGYSNQEIADDLGLTHQAVDWRLLRAQERIGVLVLPEVLDMRLPHGKAVTQTCPDCGARVQRKGAYCWECAAMRRHYDDDWRREGRER